MASPASAPRPEDGASREAQLADATALLEPIKKHAAAFHAETIAWRRHLHQHPELSFAEHATASWVAERLREMGIPVTEGVAETGVVGLIEGRDPEIATVALRGDMDALPILEANDVPYRSTVDGVMHACGHDVHTACLLGAARVLNELKEHFRGTVKLIFQPGEERFPGGASLMIRDGVLENPRPKSVLGQHVHPPLESGKIGLHAGPYMAAADELYFTVRGRGGHAAHPHLLVDPVLMTAQLITNLQRVVSRFVRPDQPAVLSIGRVIADGATNIVPDQVAIEGTFRSFDQDMRERAHAEIRRIAEGVAHSFGGQIEVEIRVGYPPLVNQEALTGRIWTWGEAYLGQGNVEDLELSLGAEDFAYFSQHANACFWRLGTGNKARGITSPIHTPTFDIDEAALETGQGLMAWFAVNELAAVASEGQSAHPA